jgi:hypothetical protein
VEIKEVATKKISPSHSSLLEKRSRVSLNKRMFLVKNISKRLDKNCRLTDQKRRPDSWKKRQILSRS